MQLYPAFFLELISCFLQSHVELQSTHMPRLQYYQRIVCFILAVYVAILWSTLPVSIDRTHNTSMQPIRRNSHKSAILSRIARFTNTSTFDASLQRLLADDSLKKLDLVVTWVNTSSQRWRDSLQKTPGKAIYRIDGGPLFNPSKEPLNDTFVELKYMLRSFEKFGLMAIVRKVFVVHSQLHAAPNYLQGHRQLEFVQHSSLSSHTPIFNRNAIDSLVHRIPGLGEWYLALMDDQFLVSPFQLSHFVGHKGVRICGPGNRIPPSKWGSDGYRGAMATSGALVLKHFGSQMQTQSDHEPYLAWRHARERMQALWPQQHADTAASVFASRYNIHMGCLYKNFIVNSRHGEYTKCDWYGGLHTNSHICPRPCDGFVSDVSDQKLQSFRNHMSQLHSKTWVNLQGPGFDDAYRFRLDAHNREYSPKLRKAAREWFESMYPIPSRFEKKN